VQLVTEGEDLQFQDRPTAESAGKHRHDGMHELRHAGDTTAAHPKTLDFSERAEFLVATGDRTHRTTIETESYKELNDERKLQDKVAVITVQ
jgi:hypothetical protein